VGDAAEPLRAPLSSTRGDGAATLLRLSAAASGQTHKKPLAASASARGATLKRSIVAFSDGDKGRKVPCRLPVHRPGIAAVWRAGERGSSKNDLNPPPRHLAPDQIAVAVNQHLAPTGERDHPPAPDVRFQETQEPGAWIPRHPLQVSPLVVAPAPQPPAGPLPLPAIGVKIRPWSKLADLLVPTPTWSRIVAANSRAARKTFCSAAAIFSASASRISVDRSGPGTGGSPAMWDG
jgi:hypothetical protein